MRNSKKLLLLIALFCMFPGDFSHAYFRDDAALVPPWKNNKSKSTQKMLNQKKLEKISLRTSVYYEPLAKEFKNRQAFLKAKRMNFPSGITAFGERPPVEGQTIAVDPEVIKPGTILAIPGWGVVIAEDSGDAILGRRGDLFAGKGKKKKELALAKGWGDKKVVATILGWADPKKQLRNNA